jgi:glycosyltransferase involved in cell wall biosynthesis
MPTVSVIIPAYRAAGFIGRAIDSALTQGLPDLEVIVVDDGSPDNTVDVVARRADERVLLVRHGRRRGAAAARNSGIMLARGEFIAFLDADDEWCPQKLARQLAVIADQPRMTFVACRADLIDADGTNRGDIYQGAKPLVGWNAWRSLLARPCVATPSVLARREALVNAGGFNPHLVVGEDQELWIRLALAGTVGFVDEPLVRVHTTPGSLSKAAVETQAAIVLPMILRHLAQLQPRISPGEIRAIMGERYSRAGRNAIYRQELAFGARALSRAIVLGYRPIGAIAYPLRVLVKRLWLRMRATAPPPVAPGNQAVS